MSKSDLWINIAIVALIVIHLLVWVIGYKTNKLYSCITWLNLLAGLSVCFYWVQHEIKITQHSFEAREMWVLSLEVALVGGALFSLATHQYNIFLKIIQYLFFGVHLTILIGFLFFMLTFKMNRLF
jgi:hypothetical protein